MRLYRLAADQGHALAQCNLGMMYHDGTGVPQDYTEAVRLFQLAADQGLAMAQSNLGVPHKNGTGSRRTTPRQCGCTGSPSTRGTPRRSPTSG